MKGHIQIYTGNGKGKTTAALGLALRTVGAGRKVFIGQFLKSGDYSELKALKKMGDQIKVEHYGLGRFVKGNPSPEDIEAGMEGYKRVAQIIKKGEYDLVIIDEGNIAVKYNIFSEQDLLDLFENKPPHVEIVVTGRWAAQAIIEKADLVTEMKAVKHYFQKGVKARVGIEK
ncbi:MAG: cob(I)yrinic acid a,c-diamide adenosyltransferase [Desulfobacula sp.]|jgi:cob(I)alamin adenosyltransferase|uniref:cob(I)yrinic acid a,c-diamide adenosyltransferase n=1 Tax=Desulfobacula sp. TaxID=2593537 RepID=UPI001D94E44C|nr:cob(I)yrinic acid a,c-diamide adenosyltransferase [Desulfobacula sp.]MBT3484161.1 cob(I)yrinic acid a,c-diamide adenosyltransferase [Desulfobacula sp.]MBT3803726.1 cob(I)yrinic acid a,c-diamide adenosyltransferase [Desulfobacula sp.]MBT4024431.1 cob(I)yrinic acid a,c-diamide adenosyltransferase [Desulfobacula sp.]MBT4198472.1 cob(I)yrinic acid a,c-diamide adenosyltransferase [Desulfobacula sp.]